MSEAEPSPAPNSQPQKKSAVTVFLTFLQLGLTSFGGPVAHLGYFREAFVERRRWIDERSYADLLALCQFLPGPASSQVGIGIGLSKAGLPGAFAAWFGLCCLGGCREAIEWRTDIFATYVCLERGAH